MQTNQTADAAYAAVGVDQRREDKALDGMLAYLNSTFPPADQAFGQVLLPIGYFANVISFGKNIGVAFATDSAGTKALIAQAVQKYDTIGIDCIASNVNDILCVGAQPLSFVDYLGVDQVDDDIFNDLARGLAEGARQAGVSICGGEIAQVGAMLRPVEAGIAFDLIGTAIGRVDVDRVITGASVRPGDVIIGLASSGLHCNGISLARKILTEKSGLTMDSYVPELQSTVAGALLMPTRIYVKEVLAALASSPDGISGLIHVSGKGFLNLARNAACVGYEISEPLDGMPIFELLGELGHLSPAEKFTAFNMGIGFCIIAHQQAVSTTLKSILALDPEARVIGRVVEDPSRRVVIAPYSLVGDTNAFAPATNPNASSQYKRGRGKVVGRATRPDLVIDLDE